MWLAGRFPKGTLEPGSDGDPGVVLQGDRLRQGGLAPAGFNVPQLLDAEAQNLSDGRLSIMRSL